LNLKNIDKQVQVLGRVLGRSVKRNGGANELTELLRQREIAWEQATVGLILEQKVKLDLELARRVAKDYAEGKL